MSCPRKRLSRRGIGGKTIGPTGAIAVATICVRIEIPTPWCCARPLLIN
jgi:hypothetical protein